MRLKFGEIILAHEKTNHIWFPWKRCNCKLCFQLSIYQIKFSMFIEWPSKIGNQRTRFCRVMNDLSLIKLLEIVYASFNRCFFLYWSVSDRKVCLVFRTHLSVLANLNNMWSGWSDTQIPQTLFQAVEECSKRANYNMYHNHFHVPQQFSALLKDPSICLSFRLL